MALSRGTNPVDLGFAAQTGKGPMVPVDAGTQTGSRFLNSPASAHPSPSRDGGLSLANTGGGSATLLNLGHVNNRAQPFGRSPRARWRSRGKFLARIRELMESPALSARVV
jgi:hypothetical protein